MNYIHFLTLMDFGGGDGWYTPKELDAGEGLTTSTLAVPVRSDGTLFDDYWAWVVTLDEGAPRLLDEPFHIVPDGGQLRMETPAAYIYFSVAPKGPYPYQGRLCHSDFQHQFRAISPVQDVAYDLLFPEEKAVIIGVNPDEYTEFER